MRNCETVSIRAKRPAGWPDQDDHQPAAKETRLAVVVEDLTVDNDSDDDCRIIEDEAHLKNALENCRHFLAFRTPQRVGREFFDVSSIQLAQKLLGKHLVRRLKDGTVLRAKIVETESYPGGDDRASHSFNGKRTEKNEPMYMEPGTAYVYLLYGLYFCFNISSKGEGAAVLLRSAKPLSGIEKIRTLRGSRRKDNGKRLGPNQLLNGPSKLCMGMAIEKEAMNKEFVPSSELVWIENSQETSPEHIVTSKRVGIESVPQEWSSLPLRFYLLEEANFVSVRDPAAEKIL